jgi:cancer susceptibility candidate protein 1
VFYEDQEKDWITLGWWENKCAAFTLTAKNDDLHETQRGKTHLSAYVLLQEEDLCHPEQIARVQQVDPGLHHTLYKFLLHMQLLSFTVRDYTSKQEMIP